MVATAGTCACQDGTQLSDACHKAGMGSCPFLLSCRTVTQSKKTSKVTTSYKRALLRTSNEKECMSRGSRAKEQHGKVQSWLQNAAQNVTGHVAGADTNAAPPFHQGWSNVLPPSHVSALLHVTKWGDLAQLAGPAKSNLTIDPRYV